MDAPASCSQTTGHLFPVRQIRPHVLRQQFVSRVVEVQLIGNEQFLSRFAIFAQDHFRNIDIFQMRRFFNILFYHIVERLFLIALLPAGDRGFCEMNTISVFGSFACTVATKSLKSTNTCSAVLPL